VSGWEDAEGDRAPICPFCGVTALPSERADGDFVCENPDCAAYGDVITP
jgi:hypothetical protein